MFHYKAIVVNMEKLLVISGNNSLFVKYPVDPWEYKTLCLLYRHCCPAHGMIQITEKFLNLIGTLYKSFRLGLQPPTVVQVYDGWSRPSAAFSRLDNWMMMNKGLYRPGWNRKHLNESAGRCTEITVIRIYRFMSVVIGEIRWAT